MEWIDEADGVFRGGGVKGLGLAGALLGFAQHPTKPVHTWVNVAGASAGAIIACYLATGHDAKDMVELMKKTKFGSFQDFPPGGEYLGGFFNLVRKHGLAHGEAFRIWFDDELDHATFATTKTKDGKGWRLKLIAVDATNKALLVLPDDLARYRLPGASAAIVPDEFPIASAARMSMSIPYFFEPVTLVRDRVFVIDAGDTDGLVAKAPNDRLDVQRANDALPAGRKAATTRELTAQEWKLQVSTIIDGGTLSNFPVWLFDVDTAGGPLTRPTFGFTLTGGKGVGAGLNKVVARLPWAARFGYQIFQTAQEAWDARFVSNSTRVRTIAVDAGTIGTTQFNLTAADQKLLIDNGIAAVDRFLDRFTLADYVNTYGRHFGDRPATDGKAAEKELAGTA
ncbi:MAG TPA: patatin-like phospholipase family protein [Gaiellaceae bacterium]|nr:patatin-like phospholipase family protein [Gaiellaceae bacterium]